MANGSAGRGIGLVLVAAVLAAAAPERAAALEETFPGPRPEDPALGTPLPARGPLVLSRAEQGFECPRASTSGLAVASWIEIRLVIAEGFAKGPPVPLEVSLNGVSLGTIGLPGRIAAGAPPGPVEAVLVAASPIPGRGPGGREFTIGLRLEADVPGGEDGALAYYRIDSASSALTIGGDSLVGAALGRERTALVAAGLTRRPASRAGVFGGALRQATTAVQRLLGEVAGRKPEPGGRRERRRPRATAPPSSARSSGASDARRAAGAQPKTSPAAAARDR